MSSLVCSLIGHIDYIKHSPERLKCDRCGRVRVVHQNKERNLNSEWENGVYSESAFDS